MPVSPGVRAQRRAATEAAIIAVGRRHLSEVGAAALSVRAIARELQMASSAIYRYLPSRDDLLTMLIVTAYDELLRRRQPDPASATVEAHHHTPTGTP